LKIVTSLPFLIMYPWHAFFFARNILPIVEFSDYICFIIKPAHVIPISFASHGFIEFLFAKSYLILSTVISLKKCIGELIRICQ